MSGARKADQAKRDALFTKLWNQGLSTDVIRQRTGFARNSIPEVRARLGLPERTGNASRWA